MKVSNFATPLSAFHILLVDDNRNGLCARKAVIEELGHTVTAFLSSEEALEAFSSTPFDLVVTDYRMPRMNGDELIRKMRELRANIPVILLSGMVDALGLNENNTGANVVIAKSANEVAHLLRAVRELSAMPRKPTRSQAAKRSSGKKQA
ncbi:MAG: response regulator [Bryobacteraceae bacterium]